VQPAKRHPAPDREVILAVGYGSYLFGNPLSYHFVGKAENCDKEEDGPHTPFITTGRSSTSAPWPRW
jgi:hypothetical protein